MGNRSDRWNKVSSWKTLMGTMISLVHKEIPILKLVDFPSLDQVWTGDNNNCYYNKKNLN